MHVHPGALLTDVGHLEPERVQPSLLGGGPEGRLMQTRGTGCHNDTGQVVLLDGILDLLLAGGRAHVLVVVCKCDVRQGLGVFFYLRDVNRSGDIGSAVADKYADAGLLLLFCRSLRCCRCGRRCLCCSLGCFLLLGSGLFLCLLFCHLLFLPHRTFSRNGSQLIACRSSASSCGLIPWASPSSSQ